MNRTELSERLRTLAYDVERGKENLAAVQELLFPLAVENLRLQPDDVLILHVPPPASRHASTALIEWAGIISEKLKRQVVLLPHGCELTGGKVVARGKKQS